MGDKKETITVCGVTFSADQVKSVIIVKDNRQIIISDEGPEAPDGETKIVGFASPIS